MDVVVVVATAVGVATTAVAWGRDLLALLLRLLVYTHAMQTGMQRKQRKQKATDAPTAAPTTEEPAGPDFTDHDCPLMHEYRPTEMALTKCLPLLLNSKVVDCRGEMSKKADIFGTCPD